MMEMRRRSWSPARGLYKNLLVLALSLLSWSCGEPPDRLRRQNAAIDPIGFTDAIAPQLACPSGGRLDFGAVSLTLPAGAIARCTPITVRLADSVDVPEYTLYANTDSYTPRPLVFEPHGLRFQAPVLVRITANRRLEPGQLVPVLYKESEGAAWQGLYLGGDRSPSVGVVLADGLTVAYVTDHFSQYIQFEAGLTTELLSKCGPFSTLNGAVPFACPQFLYGNGWPPELSLGDASTRETAYRNAIRDLVLAPEIQYPPEVVAKVTDAVSQVFTVLDHTNFALDTASDRLFDLLQLGFPRLLEYEGTNGRGFVMARVRVQNQFSQILRNVDIASLGWLIGKQLGKTAFSIWVLNVLDYASVVGRMNTLQTTLMQSGLWKDPALQAALGTVMLDIQRDFDARDRGLLQLLIRGASLRIDSLSWVSSYPDLAGITTKSIGLALKLSADANFILFATGMVIDWAVKLEEATRGGQYLAALGTLFVYGGLNKEYSNRGLSVLLPTRVTASERERWTRNLMAETVLYRMAEQAENAVSLGDVHWTQFALQRLGEALAKLAGAPLDRGAISRKLKSGAAAHQKNADAIYAALTADGALPPLMTPPKLPPPGPAITPFVSVSPSFGPGGTLFQEPGTGFSPNSYVTLRFRRPDGSEAPPARYLTDGAGRYAHSFQSMSGTQVGPWAYWAVDEKTGIASAAVNLRITQPTVSVLPSSGPRGTVFNEPGTGFTPGGSVTLRFLRPDGSEAPPASHIADASGSYSHSFASAAGTFTGTWKYWAVDDRTGAQSVPVSLLLTP